MWTQSPLGGDGHGQELARVEKHLDLTNYLNFLQNLFSLSTSDSEDDNTNTNNTDPVLTSGADPLLFQTLPSPESFLPAELPTDLELDNLLGKSLTDDVDFDLDSPDSEEKSLQHQNQQSIQHQGQNNEEGEAKNNNKGKKRKGKGERRKGGDNGGGRQNRPNSGGRGNGHAPGPGPSGGGGGSGGTSGGGDSSHSHNNDQGSSSHHSSTTNAGGSSTTTNSSSGGGGGSVNNHNLSSSFSNNHNHHHCANNLLPNPSSKAKHSNNLNCFQNGAHPPRLLHYHNQFQSSSPSSSAILNDMSFNKDNDDDGEEDDDLNEFFHMVANATTPTTTTGPEQHLLPQGEREGSRKRKNEEEEDKSLSSLPIKKSCTSTSSPTLQGREELIEMLNAKRRKIYVYIARREIPRAQRIMMNTHKEGITANRRLVQICAKHVRQQAIQSHKTTKDSVWRAKRLTREMQGYWKQIDKVEKENKKRKEKEEEEQRKQNVEVLEARKLQRKLNLVTTQTELYAYISTKKICNNGKTVASPDKDSKDEVIARNAISDHLKEDYYFDGMADSFELESMKLKVKVDVQEAFEAQKIHTKLFTVSHLNWRNDGSQRLFSGHLKDFQAKGVDWLMSLFNNALNGILADESGLGKTIQSIAFLAKVAETQGIWGPFLVMAPSNNLHHWQEEFKHFAAPFKVVPYWGNPQERKILRQFWQQTNLNTPNASFHVVVTSYNIVVQDLKYFNKVKWQYLILDEAQSIKSTLSTRWKTLIGFNSRNRLLLTGSPFKSSISEVVSLLHFIMPSLFISQEDFFDWFVKDLESNPESLHVAEERFLQRLLKVLEQFTLRRSKMDVEKELCDKLEIGVPCMLTPRQRFIHAALVRKILMDESLKNCVSSSQTNNDNVSSSTSQSPLPRSIMNAMLQFRKLCNHPDLFERREMKSPLFIKDVSVPLPTILFHDPKKDFISSSSEVGRQRLFSIANPNRIYDSLYKSDLKEKESVCNNKKWVEDIHCDWSFLRMTGFSVGEFCRFMSSAGPIERMMFLVKLQQQLCDAQNLDFWLEEPFKSSSNWRWSDFHISNSSLRCRNSSEALNRLCFTSHSNNSFYNWSDCPSISEEKDVKIKAEFQTDVIQTTCSSESGHNGDLISLHIPKFLYDIHPKVISVGVKPVITRRSVQSAFDNNFKFSSEREYNSILRGESHMEESVPSLLPTEEKGLKGYNMVHGWSRISAPDKNKLITDSGKMIALDILLRKLKDTSGTTNRVIIYSSMGKMADLIEEYLRYRKWSYLRLNGLRKNSREEMRDIFVFLSATLKADLVATEADTVIFFDMDWTTNFDQGSLDLVFRLAQNKQITMYKLFCKGTIEERMLLRSGGGTLTLTGNEALSLLMDEEEFLEKKSYHHRIRTQSEGKDRIMVEKKVFPSTSASVKVDNTITRATSTLPSSPLQTRLENQVQQTSKGKGVRTIQQSSPSSQEDSDVSAELECDSKDAEFDMSIMYEDHFLTPTYDDYFDRYSQSIEWNGSDYEEDLPFIPQKPKIGRGSGKRGRPPSRVRVQMRDLPNGPGRGPGRPRLKPVGPANQGVRRRPGRPPLSRKAESTRVFGIYGSQDLNMTS